jgi:hypothetical protein
MSLLDTDIHLAGRLPVENLSIRRCGLTTLNSIRRAPAVAL